MEKRIEIQRTADDIEIDRFFHFMVFAPTREARESWERRWRAALSERAALRKSEGAIHERL
jgi:hypothetical protein